VLCRWRIFVLVYLTTSKYPNKVLSLNHLVNNTKMTSLPDNGNAGIRLQFFPLPCTADIPVYTKYHSYIILVLMGQVINSFVESSEICDCGKIWILVQHKSLPFFPRPTLQPITESPNESSGEKIANLGQMCSGIHNPDRKPICQGSFAVLDESSIEDKTVLLVKWDFYIPNDEMRQNKEAEWPYNG